MILDLKKGLSLVVFLYTIVFLGQTKAKGVVLDTYGEPLPFCNVLFKGSNTGTITDENGNFYLESDKNWTVLEVSFVGFNTSVYTLPKKVNYNINIVLEEEAEALDEVVIVTGKQPKKNNPAIDILRKIWKRKRANGLKKFNQYEYTKYQKIEFDLNTIDEKFKKQGIFKGMTFIFDNIDTSSVTGKTYLPIFLNESVTKVYGDNVQHKKKEVLEANRNSGFNNNEYLINSLEQLYTEYNVYDNHLKFFDKSFVSPLSRTGISNYNYVLVDSSFIDNKWCYNIVYYPRRKNELTFKGDFWVNDTTFAVKEINMQVVKSANINWVKDIYLEQEFELLNDTTFVLKRDYFMSDFSLTNREKAKGVYGKKTTIYKDYVFNKPKKTEDFYTSRKYIRKDSVYNRSTAFWDKSRPEKLNEEEKKVFKMLDTLQTVSRFQNIKKLVATLSSGYYELDKLNFDYGPIFSTIGFNDVEGLRLRTGGRTYKTSNDMFRLEGFLAYGFKDRKFKYGVEGKWLLNPENRLTIALGNKRDIEQIGASLTGTSSILGRNDASSSIISTGTNDKLTNVNLTSLSLSMEPVPNLVLQLSNNYKTLRSASKTFSLDYNDPESETGIASNIKQYETTFSVGYYPKRRMSGFGVSRGVSNSFFTRYFAKVTKGTDAILESDFNYTKLQVAFYKLWRIGSLGRLTTSIEAGQTFGEVPLALLSIAPGNQTYYMYPNTFNVLDFYEFATDKYASLHLEHNFNGRIISRIPLLNKTKLRTIIGFKAFMGSISEANVALSTTPNSTEGILQAPSSEPYYEYSVGVGNIFRILRIDANFRGNYLDNTPDVRKMGFTASILFNF